MNPALDTQKLTTIREDFIKIGDNLEFLAQEIISHQISRYPIFIATQKPVALGLPIIATNEHGTYWNYRVSPLEELINKRVLNTAQITEFKKNYRNPLERACILLIDEADFEFIFIPYRLSEV